VDGQTCDRHPSAQAKARVLFPNLCFLYMCQHCVDTRLRDYKGEYHVAYQTVEVSA